VRAGPVISLVGMPGSGKTTVGPLLAELLGIRFVDLDAVVVASAGCDVAQIFEDEGETGFRARETTALAGLLEAGDGVVVATGGGLVTTAEARKLLGATTCVWLEASADTLARRLRDEAASRPLLAVDPEAMLRRLHDERADWYRQVADHVLDTDDLEPEEAAARLAGALAEVTR
jgi:shikimate kinase